MGKKLTALGMISVWSPYYSHGGYMPTEQEVFCRLEDCYDPCCADRRISVVDMGLIEKIDIQPQKVKIDMILTTGWCPFVARLQTMMRESVQQLKGVDEVEIDILWDVCWSKDRLSPSAREKLTLPLDELEPLRKKRLAEETARQQNREQVGC